MKIIGVDNYDRETVNDILVKEDVSEEEGKLLVDDMNKRENQSYYYMLVDDDHKLYDASVIY